MKDLTLAQLKLVSDSIRDDLKLFAVPNGPGDFSSWTMGFSSPLVEGLLLHSHGKKIRTFKTLDSMVKFVYENFNPEIFIVAFGSK